MHVIAAGMDLWYSEPMSDNITKPGDFPPNDVEAQLAIFEREGLSHTAAQAIADIDMTMQRIRRGISKREFAAALVATLGGDVELQHLDAMSAIVNWGNHSTETEVTVGLVAERLGIDPSRASRLVAEVVDKGFARRVASQGDARRICLELTEAGCAFTEKFRERKWRMLARAMSTWDEEEIIVFGRLLERFSHWGKDGLSSLIESDASLEIAEAD